MRSSGGVTDSSVSSRAAPVVAFALAPLRPAADTGVHRPPSVTRPAAPATCAKPRRVGSYSRSMSGSGFMQALFSPCGFVLLLVVLERLDEPGQHLGRRLEHRSDE